MDYDVMSYGIFAQVYDQLMDETLFLKWKKFVENNLTSNQHSILELGSGSGDLGILLKEKGYDIEGLDLSSEMLTIAQEKQSKENIHFPLFQADMRDLSEFGEYDAIISFCDTLCYLETVEDLQNVFQEVYNHLTDNGTFLFDVFTTEYIETLDGYSYHDEIPNIMFIWESYAGEHDYSVEHELVFFEKNEDDLYKRHEELHKERTYTIDSYIKYLKNAGFSKIEIVADFDQEITNDNERWFFKAQK